MGYSLAVGRDTPIYLPHGDKITAKSGLLSFVSLLQCPAPPEALVLALVHSSVTFRQEE
jgi:hypothetical protein